ncbi:protein phosphatase 2C domain-containing protein [Flavobacterium sp.]|uniref:protein phosphatase 2C domain-containing protein n=1 Tax=Flavobacterium sp. TaxID=239 RepID=UPI0031DB5F01
MKTYTSLKIGDYHQNNCEDHLYIGDYGKGMILCAVMDGCTTALESHFASTLVGKILKKICIEKGYKEFIKKDDNITVDTEENLKLVLRDLLMELKTVKNTLMLDSKELLTTIIIMLANKNNGEGIIIAIGDGFASVNGKVYEFEQNNKPDYLGFHLSEDFEEFYDSQKQKIRFNKIEDISISTDGIFSFEKVRNTKSDEEINVINFLTAEKTDFEKVDMIDSKLKILENHFGMVSTDDFSLIRIIK